MPRSSSERHCETHWAKMVTKRGEIRAVDHRHDAVYLLLRGAALLELEKMQQQIGHVLERLHSDKHLGILSRKSTKICLLCVCPLLTIARPEARQRRAARCRPGSL